MAVRVLRRQDRVYEPIVLLVPDQQPRTTSLLAARELPTDGVAMHEGAFSGA